MGCKDVLTASPVDNDTMLGSDQGEAGGNQPCRGKGCRVGKREEGEETERRTVSGRGISLVRCSGM